MKRGIVIAGTASGVGKTTVTLALIGSLRRRGYRVQAFKAGPDYIDPSYHAAASGRPSRNLDTWMLGRAELLELFARAMRAADFAVVEGVMGLFDGHGGRDETGSTAELAKLLRLPVVLVVDGSAAARSVGATALGFKSFDPAVKLAGVIVNRIAGERHYDFIRPAIESAGLCALGYVPSMPDLTLPERHLGLVPEGESPLPPAYLERLVGKVEQTLDAGAVVDASAPITDRAGRDPDDHCLFPRSPIPKQATVAVAMDRAFNFYYPDALDLLAAWGADIVPFSPLESPSLPSGADGVYVGGGFPELHAGTLAANVGIRRSLRHAATRGMPMYGECGGLMYFGQSLVDEEGREHPMTSLVPARSTMIGARLTLGYRTARLLRDTPVARAGEVVRGHEFHFSVVEQPASRDAAVYEFVEQSGRLDGFVAGTVTASYLHLHFAASTGIARRFVETCAAYRRSCR